MRLGELNDVAAHFKPGEGSEYEVEVEWREFTLIIEGRRVRF